MSEPNDNYQGKFVKVLDALQRGFDDRLAVVIYSSKMFGLPRFAIGSKESNSAGWLLVERPDGGWMTIADLNPHFTPPATDDAKVSAQYAVRVAQLERSRASLVTALEKARDDLDHLATNIVREDGEGMTQAGAGAFAEKSYERARASLATLAWKEGK